MSPARLHAHFRHEDLEDPETVEVGAVLGCLPVKIVFSH